MDGWMDRYLAGGEHKPPPKLKLIPMASKSKLKLSNNNKSKTFFLVAKRGKPQTKEGLWKKVIIARRMFGLESDLKIQVWWWGWWGVCVD